MCADRPESARLGEQEPWELRDQAGVSLMSQGGWYKVQLQGSPLPIWPAAVAVWVHLPKMDKREEESARPKGRTSFLLPDVGAALGV